MTLGPSRPPITWEMMQHLLPNGKKGRNYPTLKPNVVKTYLVSCSRLGFNERRYTVAPFFVVTTLPSLSVASPR